MKSIQVLFLISISIQAKNIHMGLDHNLLTLHDHDEIICDIKEIWLEKKQDTNFKFVLPQLIHTTKWKFNYIIFRKNFDNFDFLKNVYWIWKMFE